MNKIRLARLEDANCIKEIIDGSISIDFYSIDKLKEFILNKNSIFYVYTDDNDIPVACLFCEKGSLYDICLKDNIPFEDEVFKKYNKDTKTIIYKTAATRVNYRSKGILRSFLREAAVECSKIDHDVVAALCLVLPDGSIPVHRHVTEDGFKQIKLFKSPWKNIKSYCSYCKNEYCTCDGMLYLKEK